MTVTPAGIGKVLFDGQDIRLVVNDLGSDAVLLTYTARPEKGRPQGAFAKPFADKRGVSGVYIVSKWAHWWQTPEMPIVEALIEDLGIIRDAPHSLAYGGSMGGFGALLGAARLGCKYALVSGPQVTFDPDIVTYPNRYAPDTDPLSFVEPDARAGITDDCRYLVIYDPLDGFDRRQVALLENHPSVGYLPVPLASHSPLKLLNEAGVLEGLIMSSLRGQTDVPALHRRLRREKRTCPLYLVTLATVAAERKHIPLAVWAAKRAYEVEPTSPTTFRMLMRILREVKDFEAIEQAARAYVAAVPDDRVGAEHLIMGLYNQSRFEETAEAGRRLLTNFGDRFDLWRLPLSALSRLGRHDEVIADCDRLFDRFRDDVRYLRTYAEALIAARTPNDPRHIARRLADHPEATVDDRQKAARLAVT